MDPEIICSLCEYDCSSLSSITVKMWLNSSALIDEQKLLHIFKILLKKEAIARSSLLHSACRHVYDISRDSLSLVLSLLGEIQCDPNCLDGNKQMPIQVTSDLNIMKILVKYGAKVTSDVVFKVIANITNQTVNVVTEILLPSLRKKNLVWNPNDMNKNGDTALHLACKVDKAVIVRFAGHREFYSGHAALLQAAVQSTPPIFLLVVNLCDEDSKILEDILYWISFLENQCALVICKPHIIIIGSHADTLKSRGVRPSTLSNLLLADYFINLEFIDFIAMNCQLHKSAAINDLRQILVKSCEQLRIQEPITFNAHCFLVYLIDAFTQAPAVTIGTVRDHIEQRRLIFEEKGVLEFLPITHYDTYLPIMICKKNV